MVQVELVLTDNDYTRAMWCVIFRPPPISLCGPTCPAWMSVTLWQPTRSIHPEGAT